MGKKIQFEITEKTGIVVCELLYNYYYLANEHYEDVKNCPDEMKKILDTRNLIRDKIHKARGYK